MLRTSSNADVIKLDLSGTVDGPKAGPVHLVFLDFVAKNELIA
jgi:hypothetical protein